MRKKQYGYRKAIALREKSDISSLKEAESLLLSIPNYMDASRLAQNCREQIDTFHRNEEQVVAFQATTVASKKTNDKTLNHALIALIIAICYFLSGLLNYMISGNISLYFLGVGAVVVAGAISCAKCSDYLTPDHYY